MTDSNENPKGASLSRMGKVKHHFAENKDRYVVGAVCVVVGVVGTIITEMLRSEDSDVIHEEFGNLNNSPSSFAKANFAVNSPVTANTYNTVVAQMTERSTPSNIVQNDDGTKVWSSQNEAARELGISASQLSKHLSGKVSAIDGQKFHIVPKLGDDAAQEAA